MEESRRTQYRAVFGEELYPLVRHLILDFHHRMKARYSCIVGEEDMWQTAACEWTRLTPTVRVGAPGWKDYSLLRCQSALIDEARSFGYSMRGRQRHCGMLNESALAAEFSGEEQSQDWYKPTLAALTTEWTPEDEVSARESVDRWELSLTSREARVLAENLQGQHLYEIGSHTEREDTRGKHGLTLGRVSQIRTEAREKFRALLEAA